MRPRREALIHEVERLTGDNRRLRAQLAHEQTSWTRSTDVLGLAKDGWSSHRIAERTGLAVTAVRRIIRDGRAAASDRARRCSRAL